MLFIQLLHTGDERLEQIKIWETNEINLCSQSLRVKKVKTIYILAAGKKKKKKK